MERKLASIQRIKALEPIEDADRLELATVLGWKVVVGKGQFKVGELCVYVEIDSILPEERFDKPEYSFLKSRNFHIKTAIIRGQPSQGIIFPLSILSDNGHVDIEVDSDNKETIHYGMANKENTIVILNEKEDQELKRDAFRKYNIFVLEEGSDVTDLLGVTQYEYPIPENMKGKIKGKFPAFIPRTKEARIQVLQDILTKLKGLMCYITEKLDGESVTFYYRDGVFGACSREVEYEYDSENPLWIIAEKYGLEKKLKNYGKNVAIQGEMVGPNIQGNKYKLDEYQLYLFNLIDIDQYKYENYYELTEFADEHLICTVPMLNEHYELDDDITKLEQLASGTSKIAKTKREGIVIRPVVETMDAEMNGRVSFKVIDPQFLVKHKE